MFHMIFFFFPSFNFFFLFALWETPVDAFHMQHEIRFVFSFIFFLEITLHVRYVLEQSVIFTLEAVDASPAVGSLGLIFQKVWQWVLGEQCQQAIILNMMF